MHALFPPFSHPCCSPVSVLVVYLMWMNVAPQWKETKHKNTHCLSPLILVSVHCWWGSWNSICSRIDFRQINVYSLFHQSKTTSVLMSSLGLPTGCAIQMIYLWQFFLSFLSSDAEWKAYPTCLKILFKIKWLKHIKTDLLLGSHIDLSIISDNGCEIIFFPYGLYSSELKTLCLYMKNCAFLAQSGKKTQRKTKLRCSDDSFFPLVILKKLLRKLNKKAQGHLQTQISCTGALCVFVCM